MKNAIRYYIFAITILIVSVNSQDNEATTSLLCISDCATCPVICAPPPPPQSSSSSTHYSPPPLHSPPPPRPPPPPPPPKAAAPPPRSPNTWYPIGVVPPPPPSGFYQPPKSPSVGHAPPQAQGQGQYRPYPYYYFYVSEAASSCVSFVVISLVVSSFVVFVVHM